MSSAKSAVGGIVIPCHSEIQFGPGIFNDIDLDASHPIHTQGIVCPVSAQVGLPIIMYRHLKEDPLRMNPDSGLDNQRATYLMIDPVSGFAPPQWQSCVGSVTVMRKDGKPLTKQAIETIWMYHDHVLDLFGDYGMAPRDTMTSEGFVDYCAEYKENKLLNGHTEFANMSVPL
ncbi:hypothetical protein K438DRAFT_1971220 [Mycena galopus ATCC 62051]|nr:hypothetical protein K438DRAFT_1971220 [Mycena galopus ATCC 62051]